MSETSQPDDDNSPNADYFGRHDSGLSSSLIATAAIKEIVHPDATKIKLVDSMITDLRKSNNMCFAEGTQEICTRCRAIGTNVCKVLRIAASEIHPSKIENRGIREIVMSVVEIVSPESIPAQIEQVQLPDTRPA